MLRLRSKGAFQLQTILTSAATEKTPGASTPSARKTPIFCARFERTRNFARSYARLSGRRRNRVRLRVRRPRRRNGPLRRPLLAACPSPRARPRILARRQDYRLRRALTQVFRPFPTPLAATIWDLRLSIRSPRRAFRSLAVRWIQTRLSACQFLRVVLTRRRQKSSLPRSPRDARERPLRRRPSIKRRKQRPIFQEWRR